MMSTKLPKNNAISPDLLTERRKRLGLSQSELARRAGISRSLVCHIEAGRRPITDETMASIEAAFTERQRQIDSARSAVAAAMNRDHLVEMRAEAGLKR